MQPGSETTQPQQTLRLREARLARELQDSIDLAAKPAPKRAGRS